jgi:1,4-alpha-glucan branching enzyme
MRFGWNKAAGKRNPSLQRQPVCFSLRDAHACEVSVAGSFNHWQPIPLSKGDTGNWTVQLSLIPGHYEYQFIVDGVWTPDPAADYSVLNPFGGRNSRVTVGRKHDEAYPRAA